MIIISPSKNLDLKKEDFAFKQSSPLFEDNSKILVKKLKTLDSLKISSLMNISEKLSILNYERFQQFTSDSNIRKPAAYIFSGDTFNGLSIRSFNSKSLEYAQNELRILSGLYGILKPLDFIEPYRLEMGTNTSSIIGSDLYEFWKDKVTTEINSDMKRNKQKLLFNLASKEYSMVIDKNNLNYKVINFDFKKKKEGKHANIGMLIKKLRGCMAKYILKNQIQDTDLVKNFNDLGFKYSDSLSSSDNFIFLSQ